MATTKRTESETKIERVPVSVDTDYQTLWEMASIRRISRWVVPNADDDHDLELSLGFAKAHTKSLFRALDHAAGGLVEKKQG
jgi:hypothetical protein